MRFSCLVYNPVGPSLPGAQPKLEADYKRELKTNLDIVFNSLFTVLFIFPSLLISLSFNPSPNR